MHCHANMRNYCQSELSSPPFTCAFAYPTAAEWLRLGAAIQTKENTEFQLDLEDDSSLNTGTAPMAASSRNYRQADCRHGCCVPPTSMRYDRTVRPILRKTAKCVCFSMQLIPVSNRVT